MEVKRGLGAGMQVVHVSGSMVRKGQGGIRRAGQSVKGSLTALSIQEEERGEDNREGEQCEAGGTPSVPGAYRPGPGNMRGPGPGAVGATSGKGAATQAGRSAGEAAAKTGVAAARAGRAAATGGMSAAAATAAVAAAYAAKKAKELFLRMKVAAVSAAAGNGAPGGRGKAAVAEEAKTASRKDGGTTISATLLFAFPAALALVLSAVFLFLAVAAMAGGTGDAAQGILDVARQEEAAAEVNIGGAKYKAWYGMNGDWCAMFISWCADQCGYVESGIMPKTASVQAMLSWYRERQQYHTKESGHVPRAGDVVFFTNGMSHVGLVISYDPSTKILTTVEGNTGESQMEPYHAGSRVAMRRYPLTYGAISGYGTPQYPRDSDAGKTDTGETE